ncbi:hypothetical protein LYSIN_01006 [Lysinibacillus sphaericus]|uniref:Uncharacterized protein n=1 Tax=Lysinibacillus sphaericus TaxID=1421 RepID=A0A2S5CZH4_LYSSH|nr:hypothetical protein [Lysinibacillus sphaericus]POZ56223.1 hypothetical protein LYSIN_01006 [Lysinibacillus sphaericus]
MNYLSELLVGNIVENETSDIIKIRNNLKDTIDNFCIELLDLDLENSKQRLLAPFYARTILEASMTILLLRVDPFRIMSIYKVQSSSKYDVTKKSNVALLWTGDVIAASRAKDDIWNPENKVSDFDRALLGKHWGELLWIPSLTKIQDYIAENTIESIWLSNFLSEEATAYYERIKTDSMKLFSFFSKGIHYEFLIDIESTYDKLTMQNNLYSMFQKLSLLALVSHFDSIVNHNLNKEDSINLYLNVEEEIERWYTRMRP